MAKKIFVYIGSRNDESSLMKYVNKVIEKIKEKEPTFEVDFFKAADTDINQSTGCKTCFNKGFCPQDELDNDKMDIIKNKLLESDFIIWGSPVYSHNVSGDMKALIDRLTYWAHLFRLVGKPGMVFASGTNGLNHVLDYQEKILAYLGVITVDKVSVVSGLENLEINTKENAQNIIDYTLEKTSIKSNDLTEGAFLTFRYIFSEYAKDNVEYMYWKNNGLFDCSSFQELLDKSNSLVLQNQIIR